MMMMVVTETLIVEEAPFDKNCCGHLYELTSSQGKYKQAVLLLTVYRQGNCGLPGITQINSGGCRIQIPAA